MNYLLTLIALSLPLYLVRFQIFGVPTTLLEVLIYLVAIIGGFFLIREKRFNFPLKWPILFFVAVGFISALIDPDIFSGLGQWKALFFDGLLVYLLLVNFPPKKNWLITGLILSGAVVGALALLDFLTGKLTLDGRVPGIYGSSPNYLALFLAPIAVLSFAGGIEKLKEKFIFEPQVAKHSRFLLSLLALILILVGIYLSGSRGGGLAVGVGVLFYLGAIFKDKRFIFGFMAIFLLGAAFYLGKPDFSVSPDSGRISTSNNLRYEIWKTSIEIFKQKPIFGVGLSNYQPYFTELTKNRVNYPEFIAPMALTAHNLYLHTLAVSGIVGLVGLIWILVQFFKSTKDPTILAAMMAILGYGLVDTPFYKNDLAIFFWLILALGIFKEGKSEIRL